MRFNDVINSIISDIKNDLDVPCVISHIGSEWSVNLAMPPSEKEAAAYLKEVRTKDPYAIMVSGKDFAGASFPFIYDKVMTERLRAECEAAETGASGIRDPRALFCFLEDNISEFSHDVTEYLTGFDRPLAVLDNMLPFSLKSDTVRYDYNEDKTLEAIDFIEYKITTLIDRAKDEAQEMHTQSKRNIDGFEEKHSIRLGGKEIVLAENTNEADDLYLICGITQDNPFGIEECSDIMYTDDYLLALREFTCRVDTAVESLMAERREARLPHHKLTTAECIQGGNDVDWEGKLLIVKPEILAPEYRSARHQLALCVGGFGSRPNSRGNAVYVKELYSGKEMRYERHQIAGVADPAKLPEWAKNKLIGGDIEKPPQMTKSTARKPSLTERLNDAKAKAAAQNSERGEMSRPKKHKNTELE